jgi:hypothetical protein
MFTGLIDRSSNNFNSALAGQVSNRECDIKSDLAKLIRGIDLK